MRASHISAPHAGHSGRWIDWVLPEINFDARTAAPTPVGNTVMVRSITAKCPARLWIVVDWNQKEAAAGEAASLLNGAREEPVRMEGALKPKRRRGYPVSSGRIGLWT
jgi:hypothetical protein